MHIDQSGAQQQRKRPAGEGEPAITLSAIQETFRSELVAAVGGMQSDIRTLTGRMDQVEGQVTNKFQQTINLLDDMTNKYYKQESILQQMQEADREFDERLRRLEQKGGSSKADPSGASTTDVGGGLKTRLQIPFVKPSSSCRTWRWTLISAKPSSRGSAAATHYFLYPTDRGNPRKRGASVSKQPSAECATQQWKWGPNLPGNRSRPGLRCPRAQNEDEEHVWRGRSRGCGLAKVGDRPAGG